MGTRFYSSLSEFAVTVNSHEQFVISEQSILSFFSPVVEKEREYFGYDLNLSGLLNQNYGMNFDSFESFTSQPFRLVQPKFCCKVLKSKPVTKYNYIEALALMKEIILSGKTAEKESTNVIFFLKGKRLYYFMIYRCITDCELMITHNMCNSKDLFAQDYVIWS